MVRLNHLRIVAPVITFLVIIFIAVALIFAYEGQSSTTSRIVRFIAIPLSTIWLGIALASHNWAGELLMQRLSRIYPIKIICYGVIFYSLVIFSMKSAKLISLNYDLFDAGLYVNKLFRISQANLKESLSIALFEGHFQPISLLFAWAYEFANSPLLPYLMETFILASGAFPVLLMAKKVWGQDASSVLLAAAYLLSPVIQFNDILGFHPDHIVLPALLWAFYFAEIRLHLATIFSLIVLCLGGEPWIPLAAAFGLFLIIHHKNYWLGSITFVVFSVLFISIMFFILPYFGSYDSSQAVFGPSSAYSELLTGSPNRVIKILIDPRKFFFVFFLALPFLFLPFRAWAVMVVALPDLAKTLFSTEMLHFSVEGHYTLGLIAVIFIAYIYTLKYISHTYGSWVINRLSIITLCTTAGISIAHSPLPTSLNFWSNWSGGAFHFRNYWPDARTASLEGVERLVSDDPFTRVEITNGAFTPNIGKKERMIHLFPSADWRQADFIVLDKRNFKGSGGDSGQLDYEARLESTIHKLPNTFYVLHEDQYVQLWARKVAK